MIAFESLFKDETRLGAKIKTDDYLEHGKHPIVDQGQNEVAGYTNLEDGIYADVPAVIFGDHTRVIKYIDEPFFLGADGTKILKGYKPHSNQKYLYYALRAAKIPNLGYSRHFKCLKELKFAEHSEDEQQQIVAELDKLSEIISLKTKELSLYDELIKARFVEMFENCGESIRLGDCCEVHARIGWQALTKDEHMSSGDYMLVTGTDFKDGKINYGTCTYVEKKRYEMDPHIILKEDDVLITKDGTIGKVAIVKDLPKPATLNSGIFVVRPDASFNKEYISYVFRGPLFDNFVNVSKTGATIKHLNQKHLVEFQIPVPTIKEQEAFAKIVTRIDKSKFSALKPHHKPYEFMQFMV